MDPKTVQREAIVVHMRLRATHVFVDAILPLEARGPSQHAVSISLRLIVVKVVGSAVVARALLPKKNRKNFLEKSRHLQDSFEISLRK